MNKTIVNGAVTFTAQLLAAGGEPNWVSRLGKHFLAHLGYFARKSWLLFFYETTTFAKQGYN